MNNIKMILLVIAALVVNDIVLLGLLGHFSNDVHRNDNTSNVEPTKSTKMIQAMTNEPPMVSTTQDSTPEDRQATNHNIEEHELITTLKRVVKRGEFHQIMMEYQKGVMERYSDSKFDF
jgi:hypothetical protein